MKTKAQKFREDEFYRQEVIDKVIYEAKKERTRKLKKLRDEIDMTAKFISMSEEADYKKRWNIIVKDVFEINNNEKLLLINGNTYKFSDVVTYRIVDDTKKKNVLVETKYKIRNNPSLIGMIVGGQEYGILGSVALGTLLGESETIEENVYKNKRINSYYALDIELRNNFETIVINNEEIEANFSNTGSMFILANRMTEALDKAIEDAHDPVISIDEDEDTVILRAKLKKLDYEYDSLLNSKIEYKIPPEYLDGEFNVEITDNNKEYKPEQGIIIKFFRWILSFVFFVYTCMFIGMLPDADKVSEGNKDVFTCILAILMFGALTIYTNPSANKYVRREIRRWKSKKS